MFPSTTLSFLSFGKMLCTSSEHFLYLPAEKLGLLQNKSVKTGKISTNSAAKVTESGRPLSASPGRKNNHYLQSQSTSSYLFIPQSHWRGASHLSVIYIKINSECAHDHSSSISITANSTDGWQWTSIEIRESTLEYILEDVNMGWGEGKHLRAPI